MNIDNIFSCCQNVSHDAVFIIYDRYEDYTKREYEKYSKTYDEMTTEEIKTRVCTFFVHEDGDTVDVLIYKRG